MSVLWLRTRHLTLIHAHLRRAYPEEGCGILLGSEASEVRVVERVRPIENRREDARERRYLISPEQFLASESEGRDGGLDVLGFFHSHPDHPASPSAFDLEHAWPYYSYLIVSVERDHVADVRCWRLATDRSGFEPETIEELPDDAPATGRTGPEIPA